MAAQQNKNLRDELFPDGPPSPEEFIEKIVDYIIERQNQAN